jgi:hypothetical protein
MEKTKKYQISSSVNDGILEIILTDEFVASDLEELQNEVADIIEAKEAKNVLVDVRAFNGRASIIETYTSVRRPLPIRLKVNAAIVDLPENVDIASFLETTAQNANRSLKCFTDIDAARDWLKSKISRVNTDNL